MYDTHDLYASDEYQKYSNPFFDIIRDRTGGDPSVLGELVQVEINFATGWLVTVHTDANDSQRTLVGYVIPLFDSDFADTVKMWITQAEEWMVEPEKWGKSFVWTKPERVLGL